jgi:hypothetical protein
MRPFSMGRAPHSRDAYINGEERYAAVWFKNHLVDAIGRACRAFNPLYLVCAQQGAEADKGTGSG